MKHAKPLLAVLAALIPLTASAADRLDEAAGELARRALIVDEGWRSGSLSAEIGMRLMAFSRKGVIRSQSGSISPNEKSFGTPSTDQGTPLRS